MSSTSRNVLFALVVIGAIVSDVNAKPPQPLKDGQEASLGEYSWVVGILANDPSVTVCGGAIISPRHILTAGHCVYQHTNPLRIRSGSIHANSEDVLVSRVSQYVLHPDYKHPIKNVREGENDIAILVLEHDLPIDGRRSVVKLPSKQVTTQFGFFAGWGIVNVDPVNEPTTLQTAAIKVLEDSECAAKHVEPSRPQYICGIQEDGYILDGDSGSPLISAGEVIGIASSGYGKSGVPDFFTNVYHYVNWIKAVMASN